MANENLGASFSIDITDLKAGLAQANRLIRESQSEFQAAAAGMDDWSESEEGLTAKLKSLNSITEIQQKKVNALQKEYDRLIEDGLDPTSKEAVELRTKINNETASLEKNKKAVKDTSEALENLEDKTKDVEDATKDAGDGFTVGKGVLADFISDGLQNLISACGDAVGSLLELSDATAEYREGIAKLETTFEQTGKSAELATETYKELYGILGDEGSSVEAASHLAALADTEEDLAKWQTILTGVNAKWGASLPIQNLAEAANEVSRTGILTGGLTDAINWAADANETYGVKVKQNIEFTKLSEKEVAKLTEKQKAEYESKKAQYEAIEEYNKSVNDATNAEEFFQIALDNCSTEQERQELLMETLTGLYGEAAEAYLETNDSIIKSRKATADYTETLAELGEEMQPISDTITDLKTRFIKQLTPALKKDVIPAMDNFIDTVSDGDTLEDLADSISNVAKTALPPLSKAVKFCAENLDTLVTVGGTAVTVFSAFNAVMKVSAAVSAATTAIKELSAGVGVATKMQAGWNAVMAANPIGAVLTAVGLLTAGIALLSSSQDEAKGSTDLLSESQRATVDSAKAAADAYREEKDAADELAGAQIANVDYVANNLLPQLETLVDSNGKVKKGEEDRAKFILGELNEALGTEYKSLSDIVDKNGQIKDSIYGVIDAKKAQILLDAHQENYKKAIENVTQAEKARATQAQELVKHQEAVTKAQEDYTKVYNDNLYAMQYGTEWESRAASMRIAHAAGELKNAKDLLAEKQGAYDDSEAALYQYYADIQSYEKASTLVMEGETGKAISYLTDLSGGFQTVASTAKLSADEQKKTLEQQVIDTEVNAQLMKEAYENGVEGVTEEMVKTAEEQATKAKEEFYKVGGDITKGIAEGAEEEEWTLTGAMRGLIDSAVSAARKRMDAHSPSRLFKKEVGRDMGLGVAVGIDESTPAVVDAMRNQIDAARDAYSVGGVNFGSISGQANAKNGTGGLASGSMGQVVVNQEIHYAQQHSRYEIWKSKEDTAAAVKLALIGG